MKSSGPQIMEALERRIADDKATPQETRHAPVYESIQSSTSKADENGVAEQMNITQAQDIPKASDSVVCRII